MEEEIWRPIPGYDGLYESSNLGRIRSWARGFPHIMSQHKNNSGYLIVRIKEKTKLVHRMVALAFCDGYSEGLCVNHIDAVRTNNHASNLEWVTYKENIRDCMRRGTHNYKSAHKVAHSKRRIKITMTNDETGEVTNFDAIRRCAQYFAMHENTLSRKLRKSDGKCRVNGFTVSYSVVDDIVYAEAEMTA